MINKYYVLTVENCSDNKHVFNTETEVNTFLNEWLEKHKTLDDEDSFWVRNIYYGQELEIEQKASIRVLSLNSEKPIVLNVNTHNEIVTTSKEFQFEKTQIGWKDLTSGLTWKFTDEADQYNYDDAIKQFGNSLPTKEEFEQAESHGFREIIKLKEDRWYWSSSLVSDSRVNAWFFYSSYGGVDGYNRNFPFWVRCVGRE